MESECGKITLSLWENKKLFAPINNAWEIANRDKKVSLTLHRDGRSGEALRAAPAPAESLVPWAAPLNLAIPGAAA